MPVRWAYTSHIIRHKLAKEGKKIDSTAVALAKMMDEGFTHVAVQSLHTIAGEEFHNLRRTVTAFGQMADGFDKILVGYPLLGTEKDLARVTEVMMANFPKARKNSEAMVLMGHGTPPSVQCFLCGHDVSFSAEGPQCVRGHRGRGAGNW